jgi:hypothetical protein
MLPKKKKKKIETTSQILTLPKASCPNACAPRKNSTQRPESSFRCLELTDLPPPKAASRGARHIQAGQYGQGRLAEPAQSYGVQYFNFSSCFTQRRLPLSPHRQMQPTYTDGSPPKCEIKAVMSSKVRVPRTLFIYFVFSE